jgi:hypothetical protein
MNAISQRAIAIVVIVDTSASARHQRDLGQGFHTDTAKSLFGDDCDFDLGLSGMHAVDDIRREHRVMGSTGSTPHSSQVCVGFAF